MPDGPVAAAIVLVAGLILLGLGYFITEARRPGRKRRRHRDVERLPLFGTDSLVMRPVDGDINEEDEQRHEEYGDTAAMRPDRPFHPHVDDAEHLAADRENGHHDPEGPHRTPEYPLTPAVGEGADRAAFAAPDAGSRRTPGFPRPDGGSNGSPAYAPSPGPASVPFGGVLPSHSAGRPAPAMRAAARRGVPAGFIDGQTLSFAIPTDGTLQFLPGRLEVVAGPDTGREVRFVRTPGETDVEVTFGRSEGPPYRHVQLHARTVSRQHATMSLIDQHWQLRNLSTTNPVVLNGRVLGQDEVAPLLVEGDRIEMGEVVFLFHER